MVKKYKSSKKSIRKTNRKTNRKSSRKTSRKTKSSNRPKSQITSNMRYVRRHRGGFAKGIEGCSYMKVEGMNLPGLKIDNQMAAISNDCKSTMTPAYPLHPNVM